MKKEREEINTPRHENQGLLLGRIRSELKLLFEKMLEEEISSYLQEEKAGLAESGQEVKNRFMRNGYYNRDLLTSLVNLEELNIPREREGKFHSVLFEPYQRRTGEVDDLRLVYQSIDEENAEKGWMQFREK